MSKRIRIIGFAFFISLILSAMKLGGLVSWSWWFCLAGILLVVGVYLLLTLLGLIVIFLDKKFKKDIHDL